MNNIVLETNMICISADEVWNGTFKNTGRYPLFHNLIYYTIFVYFIN
jgi:hypothetical protein